MISALRNAMASALSQCGLKGHRMEMFKYAGPTQRESHCVKCGRRVLVLKPGREYESTGKALEEDCAVEMEADDDGGVEKEQKTHPES